MAALARGDTEHAWDLFLERYRRLLFATIRHYVRDHDDVMDIFTYLCDQLHKDDLPRLRAYAAATDRRARFSTWLVAVVRNLIVDWFRHRDGRHRLASVAETLPARQRDIFEEISRHQRPHIETFEVLRSRGAASSYGEFCRDLSALYQALASTRGGRLPRALIGIAELPDEETSGADPVVTAERESHVSRALGALEPEDRAAIRLYVIEEMPAAEVARLVGWASSKTVYNRVYRALADLRETLAAQGIGRGDL
jgi:RNA polymerase sigma factor (sigma-70 family)